MGELHVVDDVVLLGTPVTTEPAKWQKVRTMMPASVDQKHHSGPKKGTLWHLLNLLVAWARTGFVMFDYFFLY